LFILVVQQTNIGKKKMARTYRSIYRTKQPKVFKHNEKRAEIVHKQLAVELQEIAEDAKEFAEDFYQIFGYDLVTKS